VLEGHGVDRAILLAQHKAGKSVHGRRAALHARQRRILAGDAAEETQNFISTVDRVESCGTFAPAVRIKYGVVGQQLGQDSDVALLRGRRKCRGETHALFARGRKARTRVFDVRASARRKLAACGFFAL
jgi:hypothetical protein